MDKWNLNFRLTIAAISFLIFSLFPLFFREFFASPVSPALQIFFRWVLVGALLLAVWLFYRMPIPDRTPVFVLLAGLTPLLVGVHFILVDSSSDYFKSMSNEEFQILWHQMVLNLDPRATPHQYRFLPDCVIRIFEFLSGSYLFSRTIYRLLFMFILLYCLYRYARLYSTHRVAMLALLLYAAIYPVTLLHYAGQGTDPLSHLSFLLSFICLELGLVYPLSLCVLLGILAKETIILVPIYFLITNSFKKKPLAKPLALTILSILLCIGIRLLMTLGRPFRYDNISGVGLSHVMDNLSRLQDWPAPFLFSIGVFLPFLFLEWKTAPSSLKYLGVFLVLTLFASSLFFSWLAEARNFVPAAFPLIVIAAIYISSRKTT